MESMSNAPYYVPKGRTGYRYGHGELLDAVLHDGLWDVYNKFPMGNCGEKTSKDLGITRQDQDDYAVRSYTLAQAAQKNGTFAREIVPVTIAGKGGKGDKVVSEDEEPGRVSFDRLKALKSAFIKDGTITAGNASSLNDGACALILMSAEKVCGRPRPRPRPRLGVLVPMPAARAAGARAGPQAACQGGVVRRFRGRPRRL
jgi:acetyl-CoA C-acetyltransferase